MPPAPLKTRVDLGQTHPFARSVAGPSGMATILPAAAKQVRALEAQLLGRLTRRGYDEIILPTFEYLDVLTPG